MDWGKGFQRMRDRFRRGTGPFPSKLVERAEDLYRELAGSAQSEVVLHGDLHHWNILSAERQPWLAVDPKGVIGEPAYEVGAWLRNPIDRLGADVNPVGTFNRRVDQFSSHLGIELERLRGWGIAQAVLSAWWGYEDHDPNWRIGLSWAETIAAAV